MAIGACVASENVSIPWKEKEGENVKSLLKIAIDNSNWTQILVYLQFFEAKCYFSVDSNLIEVKLIWPNKHLTVYRIGQICSML